MIKFVKKRIKEITILIVVMMLILSGIVSNAAQQSSSGGGGTDKVVYDIARYKNSRN